MKVLMLNCSAHTHGNTYIALEEIGKTLKEEGIDYEIFQMGGKPVRDCIGCGQCTEKGCVFDDDAVNEFVAKAKEADGFVFGSPVHYAAASGALTSFLDRVFYSAGRYMQFKPAASVASARRAGTTATLDQINKYATISNMPLVSSQYWNMVHGFTPEDVKKDLEGMQTMRTLGRNMAWLLKCIELGKENNITRPQLEDRLMTNFID